VEISDETGGKFRLEGNVDSRLLKGLVIGVGIWLGAGIIAKADVIRMRDGTVLRGRVISFKEQKFTIVVRISGAEAQYIVPVGEVESVEFDDEGAGGKAEGRSEKRTSGAEPLSPGGAGYGVGRRPDEAAPDRAVAAPPEVRERQPGVGATNMVIAEKSVTVPAAADWTSTEIRVQRGQRIVINARGEVDLGDGQRTGPAGKAGLADNQRPLPDKLTGGLVAVVGDDNDDFVFVGSSTEFMAPHSGIIFLLLNERSPQDNSGSFIAQVKVLSNR
jgi:hypothetical protein